MSKFSIIVLFFILSIACSKNSSPSASDDDMQTEEPQESVATYVNPVLSISGDPFCLKDSNMYYLYLPRQLGNNLGGAVDVYTSKDLAGNWSYDKEVYNNADETYGNFETQMLFAPEAFKIEVDGATKYYLIVVQILSGAVNGTGNADIVVIEGINPTDFNAETASVVVGENEDNFRYIDPSMFQDNDGSIYLTYKVRRYDGTGTDIELIKMQDENPLKRDEYFEKITLLSSNEVESAMAIVEHPYIYKKDDVYYLFYSSGNGAETTYKIGYRTADDVTGPYGLGDDSLIFTGQNSGVVSPGAISIVSDCSETNDLWMVYRQKKNEHGGFSNREIYVDRVVFNTGNNTVTAEATRGEILNPPVSCECK